MTCGGSVARMIGAKAHVARLKRLTGGEAAREVGKALFAAGQMIQVEAQLSITRGAVSGKNHVPSVAPNPPNNDTGVLANGIETRQVSQLHVEVSSNAPYAAAQEYGDSSGNLPERPYMRPATVKMRPQATELVRRAVKKVVSRRV